MKKSISLSPWQKLQIKLRGYAYLRHEQRWGWKTPLPIFAVKCEKHGIYEDYPHGYRQYFSCPKCRSDMIIFVTEYYDAKILETKQKEE